MAVELNTERDAKQIKYDASLTDSETVSARYSRVDDPDDVSNGDAHANTGFDVVTYPKGFSGETHVDMLDADGNVFDTGDLTV